MVLWVSQGSPNALESSPDAPPSKEAPQSHCFQASSSFNMPPSWVKSCWILCLRVVGTLQPFRLIWHFIRGQAEEVSCDVSSDSGHADAWVPPHHRLPIWPHQELFKVPLDVVEPDGLPEKSAVGVAEAISDGGAGVLRESEITHTSHVLWIFLLTLMKLSEEVEDWTILWGERYGIKLSALIQRPANQEVPFRSARHWSVCTHK